LTESKKPGNAMDEKPMTKKENKKLALSIPESLDLRKSNQKKMKWISIKRNELLKIIGALFLLIFEMSTCIAIVFYAHG
jgi:hypothetical protein